MQPESPQPESPNGVEASAVEMTLPAGRPKIRRHGRRAIIAALVGTLVIALMQLVAPATDHQFANMGSILIGALTVLVVTFQLHRLSMQQGHVFRVPVLAVVAIATICSLVRFDGFSGELVPQFRLRFGEPTFELRRLESPNPATSDLATTDSTQDSLRSDEVSQVVPSLLPGSQSLGFLGNDRTGVIAERLFKVPSDPSEMETVWNQGIGQGWSSFAVAAGRAVTLEQRETMDCVTCYRLSDGELLWMQSHEALHQHPMGGMGPRSTPTIVGDVVYAQDATGLVWCLDLHTGESKWTVDLLELAGWDQAGSEDAISWGRAGSPLIVDGLCVLPYGGPSGNAETGRSLIALDAETGKVRWTAGRDQISYASPTLMTLAGQRQIVSVNENTITGHKIGDGKVLWEFEWPGQSNGSANCASAVPVDVNQFLIGKGYGGGSALVAIENGQDDSMTATAIWTSSRLLKTKFTHACVDGNIAYAISNGSLEAIAIAENQRLWTQPRRSRFGQGQILLVEDTIVAQSEAGEVVFVAADESDYREWSRIPALSTKTWNIPTVAGRYLLVRNDRQAICYLLPPRE